MNRRDLFKGVAGLAAGLLLPSTLQENAAEARRYWALGPMPGYGEWRYQTVGMHMGDDHQNLARIRHRTVPGGYRSEIVWVASGYEGTFVAVSEVNGVVTTSAFST